MAVCLLLIRHAESLANQEGFFAGHMDVGLSPRGHQQSQYAAEYIHAHYSVDRIFSSDLSRAMDTALPLSRITGIETEPVPALREIDIPCWQGISYRSIEAQWPKEWKNFREKPDRFCVPGGETMEMLANRVESAILEIAYHSPGKTVAIYTHHTPIRVLQCRWTGRPLAGMNQVCSCPNASLTVASEENGRIHLIRYGINSYLPGIE